MTAPEKPKVLCVDDEPNVLDGLSLVLRRRFEVTAASSGADGLKRLAEHQYCVIISDMRMPGMSGADFLAKARVVAPDATRMLLTGHTDLDAAIRAVNEGQIFRFLTKPCPADGLIAAVDAALQQYRLVVAERELLEKTLRGCVVALTEVLSITNPVAFGHATRVRQYVVALAQRMKYEPLWEVEVASMLAQLGAVSLPDAVAEKIHTGAPLDEQERAMAAGVPLVAMRLLADIPRIERVREIIAGAHAHRHLGSDPQALPLGSRILRLVIEYVSLERQGHSAEDAFKAVKQRSHAAEALLVEALGEIGRSTTGGRVLAELPASRLRVGMRLTADVHMQNGALVIRSGNDVTATLLERLRNLASSKRLVEPLKVLVDSEEPAS